MVSVKSYKHQEREGIANGKQFINQLLGYIILVANLKVFIETSIQIKEYLMLCLQ